MANNFRHDDGGPIVDINITPFVDVVLVLLVIFMVTAPVFVNRGIPLELPSASTTEPLKKQKELRISIVGSGTLYANGQESSLKQIALLVQKDIAQKTDVNIILSADKGVVYSSVIDVMDTLRQVGATQFSLELQSK
jgi:biopolymer transport protein ExbD